MARTVTITDADFEAQIAAEDDAIAQATERRHQIEQERQRAAAVARRAGAQALRDRIEPTVGTDTTDLLADIEAAVTAITTALSRVNGRNARLAGFVDEMRTLQIPDHTRCAVLRPSPQHAGLGYVGGSVAIDDKRLGPIDGRALARQVVASALRVADGGEPDPFDGVRNADRTITERVDNRYFLTANGRVVVLGPLQSEDSNYRNGTVAEISRHEADLLAWGLATVETLNSQVVVTLSAAASA